MFFGTGRELAAIPGVPLPAHLAPGYLELPVPISRLGLAQEIFRLIPSP